MASINKINVNNTTYEIVPGNTTFPICIEYGYVGETGDTSIYLPGDKIDHNYRYYTGPCDSDLSYSFCLKQNNTTNEITLVMLVPDTMFSVDGSGNLNLSELTQTEMT